MKRLFIILLMPFCCVFCLHAQPAKQMSQTCHFIYRNKVGDSLLHLGSTYKNQFGEAFTVRSFKYYVSHFQLRYADGKIYRSRVAPQLINEADRATLRLTLRVPKGKITSVQFLLGIDSLTNTSGVQTGDLDPAKGMFWIWNTGYIMVKLEGSSPASKAPAKQYSYDIGGFKTGENVAKQISLSLPSTTNYQPSTFIISADIGKWFYGKNDIKIAEQPMCHSPGKLAMQIADNYAAMFSLHAQ